MSYQQQNVIHKMRNFSAEGWKWDFQWRRQLFDDEIDIAAKFLEELDGINIHPDRQHKWLWREDASAAYTVGSVTPSTPYIYVLIIKEIRNQT